VGGEELSDAEREELLELCRQRLDAFREQRGEEVGCLLTQKPAASGTGAATAPRSAARSKSGCSLAPKAAANAAAQAVAQQTPHQRALEVDHIVPRNQGGSDDLSNLQALYFRCNAGKRDTDTTDFRGLQASCAHRQESCVFCALEGSGRVLLENALEALHRRRLSRERGGSALQITHHRVGGPGCDADAEEVLILRPDGAFQLQRQRQGRPVILVTDSRQGLLLGRPQHAVLHNLDDQQQAEQSLSADL
jgi:hypothetical protein